MLIAVALALVPLIIAARSVKRRRHAIGQIAIEDLQLNRSVDPRIVVVFTSPYCHGCRLWIDRLAEHEVSALPLDIGERPELATRYRISATPRIAVVETDSGTVLREWDHYTPREHDVEAVIALVANN